MINTHKSGCQLDQVHDFVQSALRISCTESCACRKRQRIRERKGQRMNESDSERQREREIDATQMLSTTWHFFPFSGLSFSSAHPIWAGTSLAVQWLRPHFPMQRGWGGFNSRSGSSDPTYLAAGKPKHKTKSIL